MKEVVTIILNQLGGKKFLMLTGAKINYYLNSIKQPTLSILLPKDLMIRNKINKVLIMYNENDDLYEMKFLNTREENQVVIQYKGVYAEDLIPFFEDETGLYCSL